MHLLFHFVFYCKETNIKLNYNYIFHNPLSKNYLLLSLADSAILIPGTFENYKN